MLQMPIVTFLFCVKRVQNKCHFLRYMNVNIGKIKYNSTTKPHYICSQHLLTSSDCIRFTK